MLFPKHVRPSINFHKSTSVVPSAPANWYTYGKRWHRLVVPSGPFFYDSDNRDKVPPYPWHPASVDKYAPLILAQPKAWWFERIYDGAPFWVLVRVTNKRYTSSYKFGRGFDIDMLHLLWLHEQNPTASVSSTVGVNP
jgi:hypothetical protein